MFVTSFSSTETNRKQELVRCVPERGSKLKLSCRYCTLTYAQEKTGRCLKLQKVESKSGLSSAQSLKKLISRAETWAQGASGPSLSSTWCVSQTASGATSLPSSLGRTGAARLRKSWRTLKETVTSASSSFWGITLMKKPILLDFLKATTLREEQRDELTRRVTERFSRRLLTPDRPGSPEVRPVRRTQPQRLFLPGSALYWVK